MEHACHAGPRGVPHRAPSVGEGEELRRAPAEAHDAAAVAARAGAVAEDRPSPALSKRITSRSSASGSTTDGSQLSRVPVKCCKQSSGRPGSWRSADTGRNRSASMRSTSRRAFDDEVTAAETTRAPAGQLDHRIYPSRSGGRRRARHGRRRVAGRRAVLAPPRRTDHADFPDALSVIGDDEQDRVDDAAPTHDHGEPRLRMHYFDSRGVFRLYQVSADEHAWRFWRDSPGFSQRFTGTFSDDGDTIVGVSQLRQDDDRWTDDLKITYRRAGGPGRSDS